MRHPVNIKLSGNGKIPKRQTNGSAGFDLCSNQNLLLKAGELGVAVTTGISLAIPEGYAGHIILRSGLNKNSKVFASQGLINSDYRGEIIVVMNNQSPVDFQIEEGDRIAQLVILKVPVVDFLKVSELDATERGEGGFGSTGVKPEKFSF